MAARFAPIDIGADVSTLPAADGSALAKLVEAAQDRWTRLFLRQVWAGNEAMLLDLVARSVADWAARGCTTS